MQNAEPENQACSDEESINCRPLPNYKHKKYLRSKFEEAMMIEANSSGVEPNALLVGNNKPEKVNNGKMATAAAQPPLPPNPPPPDSPPMIINLKQEIKDDEYECGTTETSSEFDQPEEQKAATATVKTDQSEDKPNVTMCRNFARGTCKKGAACIFAHELILSQLPGVYTFCRNFQNSVCSFPKCKFVHATVFEKEHFFRTGYLPPHTLAHLKEPSVPQPPLPPPQAEEASAEQPTVYCNAPPPPEISCFPPGAVRYNAEVCIERVECPANTASPKRAWNEIEEVSSTTRDCESGESLAKRCKTCTSSELSEQLLIARITEASLRNKQIMQEIAQQNKKNSLLSTVLGVFLKPTTSNHTAGLQISTDKTTDNLNITNLLSPNHNNLTAFLAKLLKNMESGLPPGAS